MPRLDGTGPDGNGSQTGRGNGNCSPKKFGRNNSEMRGEGRGTGRRKRLRNRRNMF